MSAAAKVIQQSCSSREGCNDRQTSFLSWFLHHGGSLDERCRMAQFQELGAGLIAAEAIEEDDVIFAIPRHMPLNTSNSRLPALCQAYDDQLKRRRADEGASCQEIEVGTWSGVNEGWAGIIMCMLWERFRSSASGQTAWKAHEAHLKEEGWYLNSEKAAQQASDVDDDAMEMSTSSTQMEAQVIQTALRTMEWGAYFDVMPTQFNTPMFWTPEEMRELQGTDIPDKIGREQEEKVYNDSVVPYIKSHGTIFFANSAPLADTKVEELMQEHYSLEAYHTMGSLLLSRAFHLTKPDKAGCYGSEGGDKDSDSEEDESDDEDGEEQEKVADVSMVPMADMLNARHGCDNARLFHRSNALEMRATRRIEAGEQIWNTYGEPPSSDLLRRYGHIDWGNPADVVELSIENLVDARLALDNTTSQDSQREKYMSRAEWACSLGIEDFAFTSPFAPAETPPFRLQSADVSVRELREAALTLPEDAIGLSRVLCMSEESFKNAVGKDKLPNPRIDYVEEEAHCKPRSVASILSAAIALRLQAYATSVEEDERLLFSSNSSPSLSNNVRNAIGVRLSEKRILLETQRVLAAVQEAVALKKRKASGASKPSSSNNNKKLRQ